MSDKPNYRITIVSNEFVGGMNHELCEGIGVYSKRNWSIDYLDNKVILIAGDLQKNIPHVYGILAPK